MNHKKWAVIQWNQEDGEDAPWMWEFDTEEEAVKVRDEDGPSKERVLYSKVEGEAARQLMKLAQELASGERGFESYSAKVYRILHSLGW